MLLLGEKLTLHPPDFPDSPESCAWPRRAVRFIGVCICAHWGVRGYCGVVRTSSSTFSRLRRQRFDQLLCIRVAAIDRASFAAISRLPCTWRGVILGGGGGSAPADQHPESWPPTLTLVPAHRSEHDLGSDSMRGGHRFWRGHGSAICESQTAAPHQHVCRVYQGSLPTQ